MKKKTPQTIPTIQPLTDEFKRYLRSPIQIRHINSGLMGAGTTGLQLVTQYVRVKLRDGQ